MKDEAFSVRLKTLMARKSLKIGELAKIMKCSKPAVSAWRGGKIPPSPDTQKRLAAALGVGVETLVFGINFGGGGECPIFSNELPPAKSK
ncbi:MAG: helix-turn-helix transcriptional regulator, partial [Opitutales bacterium]|nr:helix-turn-helix transcriptional regulator [Opitutales bacterium]